MMAERNVAAARGPGVSGPALVIAVRAGLWIVVQLLAAGLLLLTTARSLERSFEEVAGWWMVYGTLVDVGTLALLALLLRSESRRFSDLVRPHSGWLPTGLLAVGVVVATAPAVVGTSLIGSAWYGNAPPLFEVVDLPLLATAHTILIWPLVAEITEGLVFLAYALPRLEGKLGSRTFSAATVVLAWSLSAAVYPILLGDGRIDLGFALYRAVSLLPVLAVWTTLYLVLGRRLVPIVIAMWLLNAGTALAVALDLMNG